MIDLSQSTLASLLVYSVLLGVLMGVLYDVIRFIKLLCGIGGGSKGSGGKITLTGIASWLVVFAFDVLFWLIFAASSLILTYNVSGGVFRAMVYFGMLSGGAIYYLTLGKLTLKLGVRAARLIRRIALGALRAVLVPFRAIFSLVAKIYHLTIGKIIGKIVYEKRERQRARASANENAVALPQNMQKENDEDVTKYRYEREGRICFGRSGNKR